VSNLVFCRSLAASTLKGLCLASLVALGLGIDPTFLSAQALPEKDSPGTLSAIGRVLLPNGSPAANIVVSVVGNNLEQGLSTRTDANGKFQLRHVFGTRCGIHAHTPDWQLQATFSVPADQVRLALKRPLELKLRPAHEQRVSVKAGGRPATGVRVAAMHWDFKAEGTTGPGGLATLWLPHNRDWNKIAAWDRKRGLAETYSMGKSPPSGIVELALQPSWPRVIRVVNERKRPMRDLSFSLGGYAPLSGSFSGYDFEEANVRTDSRAEVEIPWLPADVSAIYVPAPGPSWGKVDRIFMPSKASHGVITVQIRKSRPVTGRVIMPGNADCEGILVKGMGFGESSTLDISSTRVRRDGSFTLLASPDYGYVVEICDREWAGDVWTGVAVPSTDADPPRVTLRAYPAIPLTFQITRGPTKEPWTEEIVSIDQHTPFSWTNARGELVQFAGGQSKEPQIEADGMARVGVRPGACDASFRSGDWMETRSLTIQEGKPAVVTLHRPWKDRQLAGHLTHEGAPYRPTAATSLRAWSTRSGSDVGTKVLSDGRIVVSAETEHACFYAADPAHGLNLFHAIAEKDFAADVELAFVRTGVYSGQVADETGKPIVGCRVRLVPSNPEHYWSDRMVLTETECDARGNYRFDPAPTGVWLSPIVVVPATELHPSFPLKMDNHRFQLDPAGRREGDHLSVVFKEREDEDPRAFSRQYESAADRLDELIRQAAACDLRVLVGATGDVTDPVEETWLDLVDEGQVRESLRYLPLWIPADELRAQSRLFSQLKLRPPKPGEILLAVLDGQGRQVDFRYVAVRSSSSVFKLGVNLLKQHAAPLRDAQKLFEAACDQARATHRRVWIVAGDSRHENCLRLAQWMHDQRALLERDYVLVSLIKGCDANVDELSDALHVGDKNVPWLAVTDAVGGTLASGDARIGFQTPAEAKRVLNHALVSTAQKLTPAETDRLIQSLRN
jgi:hypothetical protein